MNPHLFRVKYRHHIKVAARALLWITALFWVVCYSYMVFCAVHADRLALKDAKQTVASLTDIIEGKVMVSEGATRYRQVAKFEVVDTGERR